MIRSIIYLAVLAAAGSFANRVEIKPMGSIRKTGEPLQGILSCGSRSELLEVRAVDCPRMPCNITEGKIPPFQIDFKPAASHDKLRVQLSVISLESKRGAVVLDEEVLEPIVAGRPYTLQIFWSVPKGSPRVHVVPLLEITDELEGGKIVEICGMGLSGIIG